MLKICLQYKVDGVNKQIAILSGNKLSTTGWQQVSGYYTVQESGTVTNMDMFMYTDSPAANDIYYLDDVEVRPVTYTQNSAWIYVNSVVLDQQQVSMTAGQTLRLNAALQPQNAVNRGVSWSSDNTNVALVDQNGFIHAVADGRAYVTVSTSDGGHTARCLVTVGNPPSLSAVTTIAANNILQPGQNITLSVSGQMSDATAADLSHAVITYTSNNAAVAMVDRNGNVTAIGDGTATITTSVNFYGMEKENIVSVIVDGTAPVTTCTTSGTEREDGSYNSDVTVTLAAADGPEGSGVQTVEYKIGNGDWQNYTAPFVISNEGNTTIYYKASDIAGNEEAARSKVFTIQKNPDVLCAELQNTLGGLSIAETDKMTLTGLLDDTISAVYLGDRSMAETSVMDLKKTELS